MLLGHDPFREFDRLTRGIFGSAPGWSGGWMPLDAVKDGDAVKVFLDLPGIDPDSVDVTVQDRVLTVRAERRPPFGEGVEALMTERPYGTFTRQILLGEHLVTDQVEAHYADGVLTLALPVAEEVKPRRIEVKAGAKALTASAA